MIKIDLTGRNALITGASGYLGRVMAETLSECGASLVIHYHANEAKAFELRDTIRSAGRKAMAVQADVTDYRSIMRMKDAALQEFSRLDILVINAVIQYTWMTVLDQPLEDYESQFRSCVMQAVHLTKAFVPGMVENHYGRIVGINTECAMQCSPDESAYVSGKRGMDGIFRVLAKEIGGHGITVNQVAPGWTISDKDRREHTEENAEYEETVPLRRRGTDREIANAVAFLASDLAGFITGAYVPVCGGSVMPCI